MPPSFPRASLPGVAGILACTPLLVMLGACHHRPAPVHDASVAGRSPIGHSQPATDELRRGFPGVVVARTPNGGTSVRLLGAMAGGGPLLYVIDGAPVVADPSRGFGWLKPEDVLRITVLKGPAETAVYGPRGVNGVVLITTRQAAPRRQ
jgi:TonB-dependent SusC/RagA subfamily outer membrane receptor